MNKKLYLVIILLCSYYFGFGQTVWINEIHYDNTGTDVNEGVEIAGLAGTDLSGWTIAKYNGNGGGVYGTENLSGTIPNQGSGYGTLWFGVTQDGLQNGSPDGMALIAVDGTTVVQFLSYEGVIVATDGPASTMTSTNIGVSESSGTALGYSLQLQGNGCGFLDFTWSSAIAETSGAINIAQTISCNEPDWCNLQWPNSGSANQCGEYLVYARVYEDGVTNAAGADPNIEAWIGYSNSDTDPSTWTNWVTATFNVQDGNDDEYLADIGTAISTSGNYYYASRFRYNSGAYKYGGYNALGGGFWDSVNNVNGTLTVNPPRAVNWCNTQYPENGNITTGDTYEVYARINVIGVTDTPDDQGANIESWIGYSITNNDPSTSSGWTWILATYNPNCEGGCSGDANDEYSTDIGSSLLAGTYYYASRFRLDCGTFVYGGYTAIGGNFWGVSGAVNGVLTIADPDGSSCLEDGFDSIDGWDTHDAGIWSEDADNGTYTQEGVYVSSGNSIADNKVGFNDFGDWLELPPVDNPLSFTYWARLSSAPTGDNKMKVQVYNGSSWVDVIEHILVSEAYGKYSANLSAYSANTGVRIRLYHSVKNKSIYVDDIEVICVSCTSSHTISNISPESGPENTVLTITGTGFTINSTVVFNGAEATILSQTGNSLEVYVPNGVSSGSITVTESGCNVDSSTEFTLIDSVNNGCEGTISASDLFISEITDSTYGSLTYIELYNATSNSIDLSDYSLEITYNGNSNNTTQVVLTGTLGVGEIHVVSTSASNYTCSEVGGDGSLETQTASLGNGIDTGRNDSDCITLYKTSTAIDIWGDCSDKNWRENLNVNIGNEGFDFRRLSSATTLPSTTFNLNDWSIIDWADGSSNSTCFENDYSDIGSYESGATPLITVHPSYTPNCVLSSILTVNATEGSSGGNPITYQWYYSTPGDTNWTEILSTNTNFSGQQTDELTVLSVLNNINYQFYCQVRENDATCYQASNAIQLKPEVTTWDGSSWDNGAPDIDTIAVIDGDYDTETNGSINACSLIVNATDKLTVKNGTYVEVENNVSVFGSILVETKGAFIQNNDVSLFTLNGVGSSQVDKETAPLTNWYNYTYWSSPVEDAKVGIALAFANPNRRFWFDANNYLDTNGDDIDDDGNDWQIVTDFNYIMTPGKGFAATHDNIGFVSGNQYKYNFAGAFNNGPITTSLAYNAANTTNHWNLVGNPYPSAINVDNLFTTNASVINKAVYMWSHFRPPLATNPGNEVLNFSQSDYVIINESGQIGNGNDLNNDSVVDELDIPARYIPSGQSFFVSSLVANNLAFNNSMRISGLNSNNQFFKVNNIAKGVAENPIHRIWLSLTSDNGIFSQILVAYISGATNRYDGISYDAERIASVSRKASIYSTINGENNKRFAIQGKAPKSLKLSEVIPVGFKTDINVPTLYKFSIPKFEGSFFETNTIYLKDKLLNTLHSLKDSDYVFTSEIGEFNNRFEIVFRKKGKPSRKDAISEHELKIIELQNGNIKFALSGSIEFKNISILDLQGKIIYNLKANGNSEMFNLNNLRQTIYIAKVELSDGSIINQKLVKRK